MTYRSYLRRQSESQTIDVRGVHGMRNRRRGTAYDNQQSREFPRISGRDRWVAVDDEDEGTKHKDVNKDRNKNHRQSRFYRTPVETL